MTYQYIMAALKCWYVPYPCCSSSQYTIHSRQNASICQG